MTRTFPVAPLRMLSWRLLSIVFPMCFAVCAASVAQAQDASKALNNLFQNLRSPGKSGKSNSPQDMLGELLGGKPAPAPGTGHGDDLVKLLTESLSDVDEPKEIEIGRQLASVLLGAKPLATDLRLQRYVNRLGRWISLHSSRPNLPWTFGVLEDAGYNAFAAPGGFIFVTRGLIERVRDESELAGILAHEVIHVIDKHHLVALQKSARSGLLAQVLASKLEKQLPGGLSERLINLGREVYTKGLSQQDEYDADRRGVALAARAGFDPYGLVAALQGLQAQSRKDSAFELVLSTHPATTERLNQVETAMGNRLDHLVPEGAPVALRQRLDSTSP